MKEILIAENMYKPEEVRPRATWTNDCCGKNDYDGPIISLSSRYWPKGGSALVLDTAKPEEGLKEFDDGSRASAVSSLHLELPDGEYLVLATTDGYLEGDSEEEVKAKVEEWAQDQLTDLVNFLRTKYAIKRHDGTLIEFSDGRSGIIEAELGASNRLLPVKDKE